MKLPNVIERHPRDLVPVGRSSNLVFTIWAVFGGFILHFLLSNYLSVLIRPSYEEPVVTTSDIINRNITPYYYPTGHIFKQFFARSSLPIYQEIARRLVIPETWDEFYELGHKTISTGQYAFIGRIPGTLYANEFRQWYRSRYLIPGMNPNLVHLLNKKWPLKKVCWKTSFCFCRHVIYIRFFYFQKYSLNMLRYTQVRLLFQGLAPTPTLNVLTYKRACKNVRGLSKNLKGTL